MWIILTKSYFLMMTLLLTLLQSKSKASSQLGKRISQQTTQGNPTNFIQSSSSLKLEGIITTTCQHSGHFALTFDDGPFIFQSNISTYLSDRGIHGTFFINGDNWACIYDEDMVNQLKHTFEKGHLIGSHTWSHFHITNLTDVEFNLQLDLIETAMKKILGVTPKFFRPPYGEINQEKLNILKKRDYKIINWSMDSGDAIGISPFESEKRYDQISKKFPLPQIALNHETYNSTAFEVIPHAVEVLQKAGYRLVSISECLGLGSSLHDLYGYVGKPQKRDSSWTCSGSPVSRST